MSFTGEVKSEITSVESVETEKISELSAIIHNSDVTFNSIKISSENNFVIRYIFSLLKNIYGITPKITVRRGYNYSKKYIYFLEVHNKVFDILKDLGIIEGFNILEVPKEFITADEALMRSYIKGLFLISGSINDPKKSRYHLEILVDNEKYAMFIKDVLNHFDLNSKVLKRENKYMIYMKEAEKIGDFLRIINATRSLLYYEDIRIYRDHKNMTNRLNNCEQANVDKIIATADSQVRDIETIMEIGGMDLLDVKEQVVVKYRLKYKDASLQELSEIISLETGQPITKSGINHRMKKIKDLAKRIRESSHNL